MALFTNEPTVHPSQSPGRDLRAAEDLNERGGSLSAQCCAGHHKSVIDRVLHPPIATQHGMGTA